jgi:hypothetical protein
MSDETWWIGRKVDASKKKFFLATEIIVFDFELFIGGQREKRRVTSEYDRSRQPHNLPALLACFA